jgi:hypothetical protein
MELVVWQAKLANKVFIVEVAAALTNGLYWSFVLLETLVVIDARLYVINGYSCFV